ncbi:MAG: alpha/beta fold hydrolase, partial [Myxococcales bacterium]|nr:alpha/beta fold hydrolase [Myxococcales bacterium]
MKNRSCTWLSAYLCAALSLTGCGEPEPSQAGNQEQTDAAPDLGGDAGLDADALLDPDLGTDVGWDSETSEVVEELAFLPRFSVSATDFFGLPWPLDSRIGDGGHPMLGDFPRPTGLVDPFVDVVEAGVVGYALNPVVYFGFDRLPEAEALPSAEQTLSGSSPVGIIELSDGGCGEHVPVELRVWREGDDYVAPSTLALSPPPGIVLKPNTTYAAFVTADFGGTNQTLVAPEFELVMTGQSESDELTTAFAPFIDCIETGGLGGSTIAVATVFTTGDPASELDAMLDVALEEPLSWEETEWVSVPAADRPHGVASRTTIVRIPMFMSGEAPYTTGGAIGFDESGRPMVQRFDEVPVYVAWPQDYEGDLPVVLWLSGTGGNWKSSLTYQVLRALLQSGVAVVSFDAQFHGARNASGADPSLATFNYINPAAGRNTLRQEALEALYLLHLLDQGGTLFEGGPTLAPGTTPVLGHSQGALVAALVAGGDREERSYVLGATCGHTAVSVLTRTEPFDIRAVLEGTFEAELDRFHPLMALLQMGTEVSDPLSSVRRWSGDSETPADHLFLINGDADHYVTRECADALLLATGYPAVEPQGWVPSFGSLWEQEELALPIADNSGLPNGGSSTNAAIMVSGGDHFLIDEHPLTISLATNFTLSAIDGSPSLDLYCPAIDLADHETV